MKRNDAGLKCTWTNGLIWLIVTCIAAFGIRALLWYFLIFLGDADVYFDAFCFGVVPYLMVSAVFPVLFFFFTYRGYMKIAAKHPDDLHGVAHGLHGKPWIVPLILLIVCELVWVAVSTTVVVFGYMLDFMNEYDLLCFSVFLELSGIHFVVDLVLFLVGTFIFQPNLVRYNR